MTGRCGYAVTDSDGEQQPCDRPATGWRWYQDVGEHEDLLDVACDWHANEGGRRIHYAETAHRGLVKRLGFGDNITEPMADNDTIVAWFEEQSRDANEWHESQLWRNDCYVAGHPDDEDCWECDPRLRLEAAEAALARVRALLDGALMVPQAELRRALAGDDEAGMVPEAARNGARSADEGSGRVVGRPGKGAGL